MITLFTVTYARKDNDVGTQRSVLKAQNVDKHQQHSTVHNDHNEASLGEHAYHERESTEDFVNKNTQLQGTDATTDYASAQSNVMDCIKLIGETGLKRAFETCKVYVREAIEFCNRSDTEKTHGDICRQMFISIDFIVNECDLQTENKQEPSELCKAVMPKIESIADCTADQIFGHVPDDSTPRCLDNPQDGRSDTRQMPLQMFQLWARERSKSYLSSANANDIANLRVYTIPIGQGDCNFIKCNDGKNMIMFDCGSRGDNIFKTVTGIKYLRNFFYIY